MEKIRDKKLMERAMIPDILEGRAIPLKNYAHFTDYYKQYLFEIDNVKAIGDNLSVPSEIADKINTINDGFERDSLQTFLRTYAYYKKNENRYIFSENLQKALASTKIDISSDLIPKIFAGYFHLDEKVTIFESIKLHGVFVYLEEDRISAFAFAKTSKFKGARCHYSFGFKKGDLVSDLVSSFYSGDSHVKEITTTLNFILSCVLYISVGHPELTKAVNEFPRSEKKSQTLKKYYTQGEFFKVGEFFQLPPKYSDKEIRRRGHFGFRWAGPKKSYLKLTWIKQSRPYYLKI